MELESFQVCVVGLEVFRALFLFYLNDIFVSNFHIKEVLLSQCNQIAQRHVHTTVVITLGKALDSLLKVALCLLKTELPRLLQRVKPRN